MREVLYASIAIEDKDIGRSNVGSKSDKLVTRSGTLDGVLAIARTAGDLNVEATRLRRKCRRSGCLCGGHCRSGGQNCGRRGGCCLCSDCNGCSLAREIETLASLLEDMGTDKRRQGRRQCKMRIH